MRSTASQREASSPTPRRRDREGDSGPVTRSASTCRTTRRSARNTAASPWRCRTSSTRRTVPRRRDAQRVSAGRRKKIKADRAPGSRARRVADDRHARSDRPRLGRQAVGKGNPQALIKEQFLGAREAGPTWSASTSSPIRSWRVRRNPAADQTTCPGEYEAYNAQRAGAAAPHPGRHADRRRPHAQPPDDRPLADGEHTKAIEERTRDGQDLLVMVDAKRPRGVGGCWPKCKRIKSKATRRQPGSVRQHGVHSIRSCAIRSSRGLQAFEPAVLCRLRDAEAHAGDGAERNDHGRDHLVPMDLTKQMLEYSGVKK